MTIKTSIDAAIHLADAFGKLVGDDGKKVFLKALTNIITMAKHEQMVEFQITCQYDYEKAKEAFK